MDKQKNKYIYIFIIVLLIVWSYYFYFKSDDLVEVEEKVEIIEKNIKIEASENDEVDTLIKDRNIKIEKIDAPEF